MTSIYCYFDISYIFPGHNGSVEREGGLTVDTKTSATTAKTTVSNANGDGQTCKSVLAEIKSAGKK